MALRVRNYKTGAARNRRLRDLGGPSKPVPLVLPGIPNFTALAPGITTITMTVVRGGDGSTPPAGYMVSTGLPSTTRFVTAAGVALTPDSIVESAAGVLVYTFSNMTAGEGFFLPGSQDPAIRGQMGEWVGAAGGAATVL